MMPVQLRAARAMLRVDIRTLAEKANVSPATITRYENDRGGLNANTRDKLQHWLEAAGVEFLPDTGDGCGVRLRPSSNETTAS